MEKKITVEEVSQMDLLNMTEGQIVETTTRILKLSSKKIDLIVFAFAERFSYRPHTDEDKKISDNIKSILTDERMKNNLRDIISRIPKSEK